MNQCMPITRQLTLTRFIPRKTEFLLKLIQEEIEDPRHTTNKLI